MYDICLFAGTTEGRELAGFLAGTRLQTLACVATAYGESLLPASDNLHVQVQRLTSQDMLALFLREGFSLIVDATHPHATQVSENIVEASKQANIPYLRVLREAGGQAGQVTYVDSIQEAAHALTNSRGRVLVTTGSKELKPYASIPDYRERLYVRVLPTQEALQACADSGIAPSRILALQGPFTQEMNQAIIRQYHIRYLVTKESGPAGGLPEKLAAARAEGVDTLVIGRPQQGEGLGLQAAKAWIANRFQVQVPRSVHLIGMGMGNPGQLTLDARAALDRADALLGAGRLLSGFDDSRPRFTCIDANGMAAWLEEHPECRNPAVLLSGDIGFYSGAKKLLPLLGGFDVRLYPGISSLQALCARLHTSWDDAHVLSLHGRGGDIAMAASLHPKVFALVGGEDGARALCRRLAEAGLGQAIVSVGENLSASEERITTGPAEALAQQFAPLSAVLVQNPQAKTSGSPHLPDSAFLRQMGDKLVPMTKEEVRAISVAKLRLPQDAVVYDIGSGTGSVAVEIARACPQGQVYAIETKPDAARLTKENAIAHGCYNLRGLEGAAPEACQPLPAPSHAFVGGTTGNMEAILRMLVDKNPAVRIVINLIALESIAEALRCIKLFGFQTVDMVQVQVSRANSRGSHHLLTAQNPVMIITCQHSSARKEEDQHA